MVLQRLRIVLFTFLALGIAGCGIFEDTKVEEVYQNTTARYNGYFNARMLMKDVVENTRKGHQDNYNEILDVYQFPSKEQAKQNTPKCDKIIKKCTRVLQKRPETKWSDDCYFLMGKARFYKGEYSKAIQLFRYVSSKYKNKPTATKSLVWVAQTYLQQGNVTDGRAMVTNIQSQDNFPEEQEYKLRLAEAAIGIEEGAYGKAREKLYSVLPEVDNDLKYRYRFIMGQLSQEEENYHKAIQTYNKVLAKRTAYDLAFHTKINKAACYQALADEAPKKVAKVKEDLKEMLKDDKNVDFKSRIYFELALLSRETGDTEGFLNYLDKALRAKQASAKQKAVAYRSLANYHYKRNHYPEAKAYYDSTANFITPNADDYLAFKRKKDILDELIRHKQVIRTQDSLQKLASWSKEKFKAHFAKLIKQAEKQKQKEKQQAANRKQQRQLEQIRNQRRQQSGQGSTITDPKISKRGGSWYFYNETAKGRGLPQFKNQWGRRPLQDFWRFRTKQVAFDKEEEEAESSETKTAQKNADTNRQRLANEEMLAREEVPKNFKKLKSEQKEFYAQIPFDKRQMRLSQQKQQAARYELGRLYYQDLEAFDKAINTLSSLNKDYPTHAFKPASLYYLHRMFEARNQTDTANRFKETLVKDHPESEYAQILQRSSKEAQEIHTNNKALERYYQQTYRAYQEARCDTVRQRQMKADSLFENNYLTAKMAYLAILCEGKHQDTKTTFKQKLKNFLDKHKGKPVANHAQQVYNYLSSDGELATTNMERFPFDDNLAKKHVYFLIINLKQHQSRKIVGELSDYNKQYYEFLNLDLNTLMYSGQKQVLVVKDFEDKGQAMRYRESLADDDKFLKKIGMEEPNHFVATQANYKQVLKDQNLPVYAQFFETKYK